MEHSLCLRHGSGDPALRTTQEAGETGAALGADRLLLGHWLAGALGASWFGLPRQRTELVQRILPVSRPQWTDNPPAERVCPSRLRQVLPSERAVQTSRICGHRFSRMGLGEQALEAALHSFASQSLCISQVSPVRPRQQDSAGTHGNPGCRTSDVPAHWRKGLASPGSSQ